MIDFLEHSRLFNIIFLIKLFVFSLLITGSISAQGVYRPPVGPSSWPDSVYTDLSKAPLSKLEKEIIYEINKVRSNPNRYANEHLKPLLKSFDGFLMRLPDEDLPLFTEEGVLAVEDCIEYLKKCESLPMLSFDGGLFTAAQKHAKDMGERGLSGPGGTDGTSATDRLKAVCNFGKAFECMDFGFNNAQDIVVQLLIDDGVPTRGHRRNVMDPRYRLIGIKFYRHELWDWVTVINFADKCNANPNPTETK
jgi:hypothetical protein